MMPSCNNCWDKGYSTRALSVSSFEENYCYCQRGRYLATHQGEERITEPVPREQYLFPKEFDLNKLIKDVTKLKDESRD